MTIEILLATYNGEKWLPAQLDSLFAQTYANWRLTLRDDGSTDDTPALLSAVVARAPARVRTIPKAGNGGAAANFAALLQVSTADYIMCCDQDDVWMPDKLEVTLRAMRALESIHGSKTPLLVHTDAEITDAALIPLATFSAHHKLLPEIHPFSRLLVQNTVHGCTLMANRALLELALPVPDDVRMHDMWLAQTAQAFGHIAYLDRPTLYYRQHGGNVIGARKKETSSLKSRTLATMQANVRQAERFYVRFGDRLKPRDKAALEALCTLFGRTPPARRLAVLRHGLLRRPLWQNLPVLLYI